MTRKEEEEERAQIHLKQFTHHEAANIMIKSFTINTVRQQSLTIMDADDLAFRLPTGSIPVSP